MRCSCKQCGTYMVQAESDHLGCVCPDCGYRCRDCLGTDTVVSRSELSSLASDPRFFPENLAGNFISEDDESSSRCSGSASGFHSGNGITLSSFHSR